MGFVGNLLIIPVIAMSLVYYFFGTHFYTVHNVRSILMICVFDF